MSKSYKERFRDDQQTRRDSRKVKHLLTQKAVKRSHKELFDELYDNWSNVDEEQDENRL